jgi:two-component system, chemotaxis family, chemotaxis protein CheY
MVAIPVLTLVVGEHTATADILTAVLDELGISAVEHAPNGAAALLLMGKKRFELVIADWAMEPVSGLQLLKFLRADADFAEVRVILALPEGHRGSEVAAAKRAGANGVLITPFSRDSIRKAILDVLRAYPNSDRRKRA